MKYGYLYICITAIILAGSATGSAAPEPSIVPAENQWTLNVVYTQPQQITARIPGVRTPQRFWYIIITATNNADRDVPFYPTCELMTDTFQIIPAYRDTRNIVFGKIKQRHKKRYPFLESLESADDRILQGADNTKDMVIIWPDFDADAHNISLFISGLSNETAMVELPNPEDANDVLKVYLRKTLELQYSIASNKNLRNSAKLVATGKRWIMR